MKTLEATAPSLPVDKTSAKTLSTTQLNENLTPPDNRALVSPQIKRRYPGGVAFRKDEYRLHKHALGLSMAGILFVLTPIVAELQTEKCGSRNGYLYYLTFALIFCVIIAEALLLRCRAAKGLRLTTSSV